MKIRNLFLFLMAALLSIFLIACGEEAPVDINTDSEATVEDSTAAEIETTESQLSVFIGSNDILECTLVVNEDDTVGKSIADYIAGHVKAITGSDVVIVNSAEELGGLIVIGENVFPDIDHEKDEFLIKFAENDLYISYAEGASAYQAVTAVLDDALFASYNLDGSAYTLASDFEFSGKCGDYIIGDNEFNPFE